MRRPRSARSQAAVLLAAFVGARLAYWLAGVRLDTGAISDFFMQVLALDLLKEDALASLWRLHSQPPLFDTLIALAVQGDAARTLVPHAVMLAASLATGCGLVRLARELGVRRRPATVAGVLWFVLPTSALYDSWFFYSAITCAALTWAAAAWLAARRSGRRRAGLAWRRSRRVALTAGAAVILVAAIYAKNWLVVDRFAASTWDGMNLMKAVVAHLDGEAAKAAFARVDAAPVARVGPFSPPKRYGKRFAAACKRRADRHPSLCARHKGSTKHVNFNHVFYADAGAAYREAATQLILADPAHYASNVFEAAVRFWNPPGDYSFLSPNRHRIRRYYAWCTRWLYGAGGKPTGNIASRRSALLRRITWVPLGATLLGLGILTARAASRAPRRRARALARLRLAAVLLFGAPAVLSCLVELGENERFRYTFEPLIWAVALVGVAWIATGARRLARRLW